MVNQRRLRKARNYLELNGMAVLNASDMRRDAPVVDKQAVEQRIQEQKTVEHQRQAQQAGDASATVKPTTVKPTKRQYAIGVLAETLLVLGVGGFAALIWVSANHQNQVAKQYAQTPTTITLKHKIPTNQPSLGISSGGSSALCNIGCDQQESWSELVGYANVKKLEVVMDTNGKGTKYTKGEHTVSITTNGTLVLQAGDNNYSGGPTVDYTYNLYNTAQIDTAASTVTFSSQITANGGYSLNFNNNMATPVNMPTLKSSGVVGTGAVVGKGSQSYYLNPGNAQNYDKKSPFSLYMSIRVGQLAGQPVIEFGEALQQGGSVNSVTPYTYDTVTLTSVKSFYNAQDPYIYTSTSGSQQYNVALPQTPAEIGIGSSYQNEISVLSKTSVQMGLYAKDNGNSYNKLDIMSPDLQNDGNGVYGIKIETSKNGWVDAVPGVQKDDKTVLDQMPLAPLLRDTSIARQL